MSTASDLAPRVVIRKEKASMALKKLGTLFKNEQLSQAGAALDLMSVDFIANKLEPISTYGPDLMLFNHYFTRLSEKEEIELAEVVKEATPLLFDLYRAFIALTVYSGILNPPPNGFALPVSDDYKTPEGLYKRFEYLLGPTFIDLVKDKIESARPLPSTNQDDTTEIQSDPSSDPAQTTD